MMKAYLDAYAALGNQSFLNKALSNATFIEKNMLRSDGHLWRIFRNGKSAIDGFLDDYAMLAKSYIQLYQVTFNKHWLSLAKKITDYAIANFYDNKEKISFTHLIVRQSSHQQTKFPKTILIIF